MYNEAKIKLINQILLNSSANLKNADTACCNHNWVANRQLFPYDSIGYILKGSIYVKVNDNEGIAKEGDLYILPALQKHTYNIYNCEEAVLHWCHFEANVGTQHLFHLIKTGVISRPNAETDINKLFTQMIDSYHSKQIAMPLKANALLIELIYKYLSFLEDDSIHIYNTEVASSMNKVLQHIDENISKTILIDELASIAGFNSNYFIEVFKKYFNITPMQYILSKKENAAKKMLVCTDMSIKEIGDYLGFNNQNYFSEFFKKRIGYSPKLFRKINKKTEKINP